MLSTSYATIYELAKKISHILDGQTVLAARRTLEIAGEMIAQANTISTKNNTELNSLFDALREDAEHTHRSIP
jgi:hypothetical protein